MHDEKFENSQTMSVVSELRIEKPDTPFNQQEESRAGVDFRAQVLPFLCCLAPSVQKVD